MALSIRSCFFPSSFFFLLLLPAQPVASQTDPSCTCQITSRPCCFGLAGECQLLTQSQCLDDSRRGTWHDDALLCSQVLTIVKSLLGITPARQQYRNVCRKRRDQEKKRREKEIKREKKKRERDRKRGESGWKRSGGHDLRAHPWLKGNTQPCLHPVCILLYVKSPSGNNQHDLNPIPPG